jgi:hypothetical protein
MSESDDGVAHYQRPPRKGQFKPGRSGNPHGRPKGSKNLRTYVHKLLNEPIEVRENGKTRKICRAEAIAIQLVNNAAKGDPKGLAAIMNLTREQDDPGTGDGRLSALSRAEDEVVMASVVARIRAAEPRPPTQIEVASPALTVAGDPSLLTDVDLGHDATCDLQDALQ